MKLETFKCIMPSYRCECCGPGRLVVGRRLASVRSLPTKPQRGPQLPSPWNLGGFRADWLSAFLMLNTFKRQIETYQRWEVTLNSNKNFIRNTIPGFSFDLRLQTYYQNYINVKPWQKKNPHHLICGASQITSRSPFRHFWGVKAREEKYHVVSLPRWFASR